MILLAILQAVAQLTVADSVETASGDLSFRAGYAVASHGTWGVEFYVRDDGGDAEWVVRRSLMTDEGREQVRWLAESDCPSVRGVVEALDTVTLGSIRPAEPVEVSDDAPLYTVWGRAWQPDGSPADYSVSALSGEIAAWADMAEKTLTSCWVNRTP